MTRRGETRIGVYGLAIGSGRDLLARTSPSEVDPGFWALPGGVDAIPSHETLSAGNGGRYEAHLTESDR